MFVDKHDAYLYSLELWLLSSESNAIYLIKQDIMFMYVAYSWPNGRTEWAEIFCGHSLVTGGCFRLKKIDNFFPTGNSRPFS